MLKFGNTPVPVTVSWSSEERFFIAPCPYYGNRPAICQDESIGVGTPLFGKPHAIRQRRVIALDQCDLCGKSLKARTKVSLSYARPQPHGANGWAILQVEPMLHAECAAICIRYCPSLRRGIDEGHIEIRQVLLHRTQCAIMDEVYTETMTGKAVKALGHAKVELRKWHDRDLGWLQAKAGQAVAA